MKYIVIILTLLCTFCTSANMVDGSLHEPEEKRADLRQMDTEQSWKKYRSDLAEFVFMMVRKDPRFKDTPENRVVNFAKCVGHVSMMTLVKIVDHPDQIINIPKEHAKHMSIEINEFCRGYLYGTNDEI